MDLKYVTEKGRKSILECLKGKTENMSKSEELRIDTVHCTDSEMKTHCAVVSNNGGD